MTDKDEWSLAADGGAAGQEPGTAPSPPPVAQPSPRGIAPVQQPAHQPAGWSQDDPLRLSAGMSSVKRQGRWTVPPFIRVSPTVGSVVVDCLGARPGAGTIAIHVTPGVGSVRVYLPQGWAADVDRLGSGIGSVTSKVPQVAAPDCPVLVFTGTAGAGSVKITGPTWWRRGPRA